MKNILIIAILLCIGIDSWGQFRRRDRTTQGPAENRLNYANPEEYFIGGIEVTGLRVLDKNAIVSLTGLKVGDKIKIPGDAITGAIRKLWKHGLVGDVTIAVARIEGDNVFLNITLAERPRLTGFYFEGIAKSKESSLKEDLDLIKGRIVNDAMIRNTELAVKKHFVKKGFLNTEVKIVQERDTLSREGIKLKIQVNPNSKVKINRISFEGNDNLPDASLKKKMKGTHEHPRITIHRAVLSWIFSARPSDIIKTQKEKTTWAEAKEFLFNNIKPNVFTSSKFITTDYEDDKKNIIAYYNSKGYRDAEILDDTVYSHNNRTVNIDFKINEGAKYYFRNILWTGNYIHTEQTLNAILGIKKGDVYNKEMIERKLTFNPKGPDISGLYMDDGYLFFQIKDVEVAVGGDSIDVEMRISEGEQATIDEVTFSGNLRTSDHVVRRELRTIPGQKFRRSDIIRTQQALAQLGYFDPEKITQNFVPNQNKGTVDINWGLEEQSNDQIELSGGWGGFYGFVGTLGLTFNNFSLRNVPHLKNWDPLPIGDGQRLSVRAQANGKNFQSYSLSFTEPWLGGRKQQSLTVSLSSSIQRDIYSSLSLPDSIDAPKLVVNNISVGLGKYLEWPDDYFTLTNSLSYSRYELLNYGNLGFGFGNGAANNFNLNMTLSRRSTGDPKYPAEGSEISLSVTLTPPYSLWRDIDYNSIGESAVVDESTREEFYKSKYKWIEYHKWMFDSKYYLPLDNKKKLVLEARAHFGFIGSYSKKYGVGPFERFVLGGSGLAGGFNTFLLAKDIIALRGYEDRYVTPPFYADIENRRLGADDIEGGIVYDKFSLELRYPVTTGSAATIYGFAFTEAGNNWNNFEDFNPFKLYKSAGLGVRLFMPAFGLIGLNWAYGFDKLPFAEKISGSQFHFTIGQQIR